MDMSSKVLIAIPTYWTWKGGKCSPGDAIYDHPTPLDQKGTLARTLKSLKNIKGSGFKVMIITAATNPQLEESIEAKVREIIKPFKKEYPITQFAFSDLKLAQKRLEELGIQKEMIGLNGYGNIRNIQLIVAQIMGIQIVVGLDDDEIVTDKDYLRKVLNFIGKKYSGKFIGGIAGFYFDDKGNNKSEVKNERVESKNPFHHKKSLMNAAIEKIERETGRLVETSIGFGGNMVIHSQVFQKIPFDPYIPRGEDIDYIIDAYLSGYHFFFDKELFIVHLPPPSGSHLKEDVIRFIYEREKLRKLNVNGAFRSFLEPYPGAFLHDDQEEQVYEVLIERGLSQELVEVAKRYSEENLPRFFKFQKEWPEFMEEIKDDEVLKERFMNKWKVK